MRKLTLLISGMVLAAIVFFAPAPAYAEEPNLIANPSMETAVSGKPQDWKTDAWGTNTNSFTYVSTGHTGTRSLKAQVTSYSSGDAKWYFTPVTVTSNTSYTFSDYYQSNTTTQIIVRYTKTNGSFVYEWLGTVAPSTGWTQTNFSFVTPASTSKVTVYHIVSSVGQLTIDDASLKKTVTTPPPPPPVQNLIANPSVETNASNLPSSWQSSKWGTNTATLSYLNTGRTGTHSVKTQITSYTNGDAKWFFNPVTVTPGKRYTFSDYYQSNTPTQLVVAFTNADGSQSYQVLGDAPTSASWKQVGYNFTVPATATKASVYHIVASVGWLVVDDASLAEETSGLIPNPSLETVSPNNSNTPSQWTGGSWGTNTATYSYMNEGHTGNRSVKVTLANYVDGDAKWYYDPQPLAAGKTYEFSAWYKTNTIPQPVVQYQAADDTIKYLGIPSAMPNGSTTQWQFFHDTFTLPAGAKNATVFFKITANGWLQTDDYKIEEHTPVGFNRGLVSLTFDDGEEDNVDTALPVLQSYGFKSTQCFATEHVEGNASNSADVLSFKNAGHEICSHTVTHPFLTQLNATDLNYELSHSKSVLETLTGQQVKSFASPYGDYNTTVNNAIKPLYRSHRTVDEGYNAKDNLDPYRIRVQNMLSTTTLAEYQSWLNYAKTTKTWLVLVYHRIAASDVGPYDTPQANFGPQMQALQASGLTVKTFNAALDELTPQL